MFEFSYNMNNTITFGKWKHRERFFDFYITIKKSIECILNLT